MTCSWTVRMLCLNNSGELGSWPWWRERSWIVWGMNDGCGWFENEKVGNGFSPEMKRCGAGSIYWIIIIMEGRWQAAVKRSCKSVIVNTYHRMVHSFGLDFVVDAHGKGWQFNGVVHGMRALWPDPNVILNPLSRYTWIGLDFQSDAEINLSRVTHSRIR